MSRVFFIFVALLFVLDQACSEEDYYAALGVSRTATEDEIKRAFRKLSMKYHPDKNAGDQGAKDKFVKVNRAYEVLSDPEKRQVYDLRGEEGLKKHEQQGAGGGGGFNPLMDLFGGGGGGGGQRKGPNAHANLQVTLEELYSGTTKQSTLRRNILCTKCRGSGAKDGATKKCKACNGQGVRMTVQQMMPGFNVQMQTPCDKCGGRGVQFQKVCPHCEGRRVEMDTKQLNIDIERGMPNGYEIVFEKHGEQAPDIIPGDVIFKIQEQPHPRFKREGNDLHYTMRISLLEALVGFRKELTHLDNHKVSVSESGVTIPGGVQKIAEEGMPVHNFPSQRGDLYVKFLIDFPKSLNDKQKEAVRKLLSQ